MGDKHIKVGPDGTATDYYSIREGNVPPPDAVPVSDAAWAAYCADPEGNHFDANGRLIPRPQAEVLAARKAAALTRLDHIAARKAALTALLALDIGPARAQVLAANSPAQLAAALSNLPEV